MSPLKQFISHTTFTVVTSCTHQRCISKGLLKCIVHSSQKICYVKPISSQLQGLLQDLNMFQTFTQSYIQFCSKTTAITISGQSTIWTNTVWMSICCHSMPSTVLIHVWDQWLFTDDLECFLMKTFADMKLYALYQTYNVVSLWLLFFDECCGCFKENNQW